MNLPEKDILFRIGRRVAEKMFHRISPKFIRLNRTLELHNCRFSKPNVIVIGAAGGIGPLYYPWVMRNSIVAAGFEPEKKAFERLTQRNKKITWYPYALGDKNINSIFYLTKNLRCSSCLEPNMDLLSEYPVGKWFSIQSTQKIKLRRFDTLYESGKIFFPPDFLHFDVQGFEYQVLEGFGRYLDATRCVEIETQLKPIYKRQRLFFELKEYLEQRGFYLRAIEPQGYFEGEILELNAFFVKKNENLDDRGRSLVNLWETICMLGQRPVVPTQLE